MSGGPSGTVGGPAPGETRSDGRTRERLFSQEGLGPRYTRLVPNASELLPNVATRACMWVALAGGRADDPNRPGRGFKSHGEFAERALMGATAHDIAPEMDVLRPATKEDLLRRVDLVSRA